MPWETLRELQQKDECDRRYGLRPWEPGLQDEDDIRTRLDRELLQIAKLEAQVELGVGLDAEVDSSGFPDPDFVFLDEFSELFQRSPAFSQYVTKYLYFGVRFAAARRFGTDAPREAFNARALGLIPPEAYAEPDLGALHLQRPFDIANQRARSFFDGAGPDEHQFALWLRGLLPPKNTDDATSKEMLKLREDIISWASKVSSFYKSLGKDCPSAARWGVLDLFYLSKALRAQVTTECIVSYCGASWLHLIYLQTQNRELLEIEKTLRAAFDFACDLVQNSIEISNGPNSGWRYVHDRELFEITAQRQIRNYRTPVRTKPPENAQPYWSRRFSEETPAYAPIGIALSGGGIRTATFCLGILERLREIDVLRQFDYLSTVSGGGYIGSWLVGNVRRAHYWLGALTSWKESIDHLRKYSKYLAPESGIFSLDTWVMYSSWIRNAFLIQLLAISWLCAALVAGRLFPFVFDFLVSHDWISLLILAICASSISAIACWQLLNPESKASRRPWAQRSPFVATLTSLAGSFSAAAHLWHVTLAHNPRGILEFSDLLIRRNIWGNWDLRLAGMSSLLSSQFWLDSGVWLAVVFLASYLAMVIVSIRDTRTPGRVAVALLVPPLSLGVAYLGLTGLLYWFGQLAAQGTSRGGWYAFTFGPMLALCGFTTGVVFFIGLVGRSSADWRREWWTRYGSQMGQWAVIFFAVALATIFGPLWMFLLAGLRISSTSAVVAFIGSTVGSLLAGKSEKTKSDGGDSQSPIMQLLGKLGAVVFIAGGVLGIATLLHLVMKAALLDNPPQDYWALLSRFHVGQISTVGIIVSVIALIFTWRFDLNVFGLNQFYRNRLVRCYLGATRWIAKMRHENAYTGFDEKDELKLSDLRVESPNEEWNNWRYRGPFPIINCALNLGGSSDLEVKTRHSASFSFTPLACGSTRTRVGFTENVEDVTLGQAFSISGAAASPNMGYNTSPLISFLLTMFNVRLGWWFPHPKKGGKKSQFHGFYLFQELLGMADENSALVNLSDGGHFENLGIYELIRRRMKVIVACDGECDPDLTFESLGKLIRICETDFGAHIDIDVDSIRKSKESWESRAHCAVGRITYSSGGTGYLIYLKSSLTGDEDVGIEQYHSGHPTFPHETTANQFFTEDQFEAYRRLGHHVATVTFRAVEQDLLKADNVEAAAEKLYELWTPVGSSGAEFVKHTNEFEVMMERMRGTPGLTSLFLELTSDAPAGDEIEPDQQELAMCLEILQLMENVYIELRLDETWDHPDNRGWTMLFTTWAKSGRLRRTWRKSRTTYGIRFELFCNERLGMQTDHPVVRASR